MNTDSPENILGAVDFALQSIAAHRKHLVAEMGTRKRRLQRIKQMLAEPGQLAIDPATRSAIFNPLRGL